MTLAVVRVPNNGKAPPAETPPGAETPPRASQIHEDFAYAVQPLALRVALGDGREILRRPETVAVSAFTAGHEELAAALFQRVAPLELPRRAIWLGCARRTGPLLARPATPPVISVAELAALVREAARTPQVEEPFRAEFPESYWKRVLTRGRRAA